jgi:hypothetical protein
MGGGRTNVVLFGLLWFLGAWVHQCPENPNATSRLDLLHAIVKHGTAHVDSYHHNTTDKAWWNGHYYSDKPPGFVLWALPCFAGLSVLLGGDYLETESGWLLSSWLSNASSIALLSAVGGVCCFCWLRRWTTQRAAMMATLTMTLGTPLLPYACSWFPHAGVTGLLFIALNIVDPALDPTNKAKASEYARWTAAGLISSLAWSAEYSAAIPLISLGLVALHRDWRNGCAFVAGWAPGLLFVGGYHWLCFGAPWVFPYRHTAVLTHMHDGLCGIHFPPPADHLAQLAMSPERGLLVCSPFLLGLGLGWRELYRRHAGWFYPSYLAALLQWILIGGYADLPAGNTYGPRLLLCMLPWLALPVSLAFLRSPHLMGMLASVACLLNAAVVWSGIERTPGKPIWKSIAPSPSVHHLGEMAGLSATMSATVWLLILIAGIAWLWHRTRPLPQLAYVIPPHP